MYEGSVVGTVKCAVLCPLHGSAVHRVIEGCGIAQGKINLMITSQLSIMVFPCGNVMNKVRV
eukprot:742728-Amphidinium_carterae.1